MKPMIKVYLTDDQGEKFFGEGPWRLLTEIRSTGSLRSAAGNLAMAYTKALKILNRAEAVLGYPLLTRAAGGRSGGGSALTAEGEMLLSKYEAYRDGCREANRRIYQEIFGEKRIGCIIMASGQGRRFGGNKLLAELGGRPLISWILDATEGVFAKRVVVTRQEEVADLCKKRGVPVVLHSLPHRSDTVQLGLEWMGDAVDGCMFCPADQPLLGRETLLRMVEHAKHGPDRIWRLAFEGRAGTPVIFPRRFFDQLKHLPQGKGGSVLIRQYPGQVELVSAETQWELRDVDTVEDLEKLRQYLG